MNRIKDKNIRVITSLLLTKIGGDIYLYHVSRWNSVYLKFRDEGMKSIRIGDHTGREKYKYKWNLEIDGSRRIEFDRGVERFYYGESDIDALIKEVQKYRKELHESRKITSGFLAKIRATL